jgi:hypothetical protein
MIFGTQTKRMKKLTFLILLFSITLSAQDLTQTVRGTVVDRFTQIPLPNTAVIIQGAGAQKVAVSDLDGNFRLEDVPVSRITLTFNLLGYQVLDIPNINVTSAKEVVLWVEMDQSLEELDEIVLKEEQEMRTENEMVTLSGRTFAIEETQRFAGARNDVARMASKMPGVRGTNDAVNDIVIRGNAPSGLLWRLEGVDIPNPNHFGKSGATGGPVSMLNNNVLRNSDFLTAAFPALYTNALSGVFDLKMRSGNNQKHEFLGQIGFNGVEFGAEGPINRKKGSSYMVSYRYSVLGLMKAMGMNFGTGAAVPEYQDIAFKLNFPMAKGQSISFFGMAGNSKIDFIQDPEEENFYAEDNTNTYSRTNTGVVGGNYFKSFGKKTLLNISASASTLIDGDYLDTLDEGNTAYNYYGMDFRNAAFTINAHLSHKLNAKNSLKFGIYNSFYRLNMLDSVYNDQFKDYVKVTNIEGNTALYRPYAEWQLRPSLRFKVNAGLALQILSLTGEASLEPRLGMSFAINAKNSINVAYGLHSQLPASYLFFRQTTLDDGTAYRPNENLGFTKSHHFVVGYDYQINPTLRFRTEAYYQNIQKAVVEQNSSPFSLLNVGSFDFFIPDSLENSGTGYNYGVDITIEQFMNKGLYFFTTLSLYNSRYQGSDKIERYTAWAGDFVTNLVGGKEFVLKSNKEGRKFRNSITFDASLTYAGGQRYTPVDVERSEAEGVTYYDWDRAFEERFPNYFRCDVRIAFRMQGKRVSQEWALDIQNLTNQQNVQSSRYNPSTQQVDYIYQIGILPIFQYRVEF